MTINKELTPVTARGEATRRKLLAAAEIEIGEKGFHVASVSSITTRADVGQGTFYLYFHSKDEIFLTLVRDIGSRLRKHMALAIEGIRDRVAAERRGLEAFFEFAHAHPGLYRIVQESQFVDEAVFREYYERLAESYAEDLAEATGRGELAPGNAVARAWSIMGIGHFIGMRWCLWQQQVPGPDVVDGVMDLIARGIAPR
ncbi:MAG: TetR/AcrR family transcriptional regulator [Gammaproteobacteria bacterium]|uniref:TetR/AcrR family transcriptional regulator n=1 Tax=Nevskia sp. TaxID=1929292 RepID=UPI004035CC99|nr:TetR/AcrR family transcriptional regulator [Gammaproteobacteria bacterium]